MSLFKTTPLRSKAIRNAARGQTCTMRLWCCQGGTETTVFAHSDLSIHGKETGRQPTNTLRGPNMQTRLGSLIEAIINILIGYGIAVLSQVLIFPLFEIHVSLQTNLWIGAWFTVISLVRSYAVRRWFNARIRRISERIAA